MNIFYFVAGASGSGKTAIKSSLRKALDGSIAVYDFDDIGVLEGADKSWRQESTEKWLQRLLREKQDACLLGQMVLGEILACPSAGLIDRFYFCLLDVTDIRRIKRLRKRNTYGANQDTLSWAAWLRVHHQDPQWEQHVLKEGSWQGLDFRRWDKLEHWGTVADIKLLDTSERTINEVAVAVSQWINECQHARTACDVVDKAGDKLDKACEQSQKLYEKHTRL